MNEKEFFLLGIIISILLLLIYRYFTRNNVTKSYDLSSVLFVLYLAIALSRIVGFPNLAELSRLTNLGESLFHPVINYMPFSAGIDLSSILNIFFFLPLGVALPMM